MVMDYEVVSFDHLFGSLDFYSKNGKLVWSKYKIQDISSFYTLANLFRKDYLIYLFVL